MLVRRRESKFLMHDVHFERWHSGSFRSFALSYPTGNKLPCRRAHGVFEALSTDDFMEKHDVVGGHCLVEVPANGQDRTLTNRDAHSMALHRSALELAASVREDSTCSARQSGDLSIGHRLTYEVRVWGGSSAKHES